MFAQAHALVKDSHDRDTARALTEDGSGGCQRNPAAPMGPA